MACIPQDDAVASEEKTSPGESLSVQMVSE
jgi:hypothetical protein